MSKNKTYLYYDGIKQLAADMNGDESIHVGIRPYELHAGNKLALVVYPLLLCEELVKLGKTPRFNIILSLNDWEQRVLAGTNIYKYTYDIRPLDTTIQYATESDGKTETAKLWGEKIVEVVKEIQRHYKNVTVTPVFNSELKSKDAMKEVILKTLSEGANIKELMLQATGRPSDGSSAKFSAVVCPKCKDANTEVLEITNDNICAHCPKCHKDFSGNYIDFMYWLHHKPLFAARWRALKFPYSLSGGDHYNEGDVEVRRALYQYYFDETPPNLGMIFSSVLIGNNGDKMSKSRRNYFDMDIRSLTEAERNNGGNKFLELQNYIGVFDEQN
jgi:hypothetical protein